MLYEIHKPVSKMLDEYMIRVLLVLAREDKIPVSIIVERAKSSPNAVYNALRKLIQSGLISEEREEDFPRRRLISLTDRGRKVAELLVEIEKVLIEDVEH